MNSIGNSAIGTRWRRERLPDILSNAGRSVRAEIVNSIGRIFPIWQMSVSRLSRLSQAANSSSQNTKARADASIFLRSKNSFFMKWAIRIRISRPMSSPILRRFISKTTAKTAFAFTALKGKENTEFYKVSIAYSAGWKAVGTLVYSYPDAYEKAKAADQILTRTTRKN